MKNKPILFSFFPFLTIFLFISIVTACVTGSEQGSWSSYPDIPANWNYRTGEIQVTIDHVSETNIASQLGVIAETLLNSEKAEIKKGEIKENMHAVIDIQVEQRSFLYGAELLNTIYFTCLIRDEHGEILGRENEYISGKGSIVSSKEQYRILKKILSRILIDRKNTHA